jgi:hypothetical protein
MLTEHWVATLFEINWRFVVSMWSLRNEELHGASMTEKSNRRKQKLIKELMTILHHNQELPVSKMEMISINPGRYSELSLHQLQTYVYGAPKIMRTNSQQQQTRQINAIMEKVKGGKHMRDKGSLLNQSEIDPG